MSHSTNETLEKQASNQVENASAHEPKLAYRDSPVAIVSSDTHNGRETVMIGNTRVYRDELVSAFGGLAQPGPSLPSKLNANPAVLGLSSFALTTFVLSLVNARAMGVDVPNVVAGLAFFYGGACQIIAGIFEFLSNNTFGATAFCSYGGFWLSYAAVITDAFGIIQAYTGEDKDAQLASALGFFLLGWSIFTYMLWICTIRSTWAFTSLFFFLGTTFLLLSIGEFCGSVGSTRAGGVLGVIVAFIAWYNAYAGLANPENTYVTVKPFFLPNSSSV